jgi:hypothetical protein
MNLRWKFFTLFVLVSLAIIGKIFAQEKVIPIAEQETILYNSIEKVLKKYPEMFKDTRVLGIGSWMAGKASATSDIDATLAHPDKRIEEQLVTEINQAIGEETRGRGSHSIKLIRDRDPHFDELFRGETGQKFVLDYANKNNVSSCFRWDRDAEGNMVRRRTFTESFWTDRKLPVPQKITRPQTFVEDSVVFLEKIAKDRTLSLADKALDAAKYMNNVEGWMKKDFQAGYGVNSLPGTEIPASTKRQMEQMVALKSTKGLSDVQRREALKKILGVATEEALDGKLKGFIENTGKQLMQTRDKMEVLDFLMRSGKLPKGADVAKIIETGDSLLSVMKGAGKALALLDVYDIANRYYTEGPEAAMTQTLVTLIASGVPEAAVAQVITEVGKTVIVGGVTLAGQYFIFDPLNEAMLKKIYDPSSPYCIFKWEESPLGKLNGGKGISRETLYYWFPKTSEEEVRLLLQAAVERYVTVLSGYKGIGGVGVFTADGAGAIQPRLLGQLIRDWSVSRKIANEVEILQVRLTTGDRIRARLPLALLREGQELRSGDTARTVLNLPVGKKGFAHVDLLREYDAITQAIAAGMKPSLYDYWGQNDLKAAYRLIDVEKKRYMEANGGFDRGFGEDVTVTAEINGAAGWQIGGEWPHRIPDLRSGTAKASGEVDLHADGFQQVLTRSYALELTPSPEAKGPITIVLTFALEKPGDKTYSYRIEITASPEKGSINIAPAKLTLNPGGSQMIEAKVTGMADNGVLWSVVEDRGGTVTPEGRYTAPDTPGVYTILAASKAAAGLRAQATVTVQRGATQEKTIAASGIGNLGWKNLIALAPIYQTDGIYPTPAQGDVRQSFQYDKMGPMGDFPANTQFTWYKIIEQGSCPKNGKQEPYRFWSQAVTEPWYPAGFNIIPPGADGRWPAVALSHQQFLNRNSKTAPKALHSLGDMTYSYQDDDMAEASVWLGPFVIPARLYLQGQGICDFKPEMRSKLRQKNLDAAVELARSMAEKLNEWYRTPVANGPGIKGLFWPFDANRYALVQKDLPEGFKPDARSVLPNSLWNATYMAQGGKYAVTLNPYVPGVLDETADAPLKKAEEGFKNSLKHYADLAAQESRVPVKPETLVLPGADEAQRLLWRIRDSRLAMEIIVARKLNTTTVIYVEYGAKVVGNSVAPSPYGMGLAKAVLAKLEADMPGQK